MTQQNDRKHASFDWFGAFTGVCGLVLFNFAWNRAPAVGWASAQCIPPLMIGFVLLAVFPIAERNANNPLIPIKEMSSGVWVVLLVIFMGWSSFGILIFYSMKFVLQLRMDTMLDLGAQLVPVIFTGIAASLLASFLLGRGIRPPWVLVFALIWFMVPLIILAQMPVHQSYWLEYFWVLAVAPFGMDLSFTAGTILVSNMVPKESQGIAAALIATVVYYSQSLGLGIAGTVQNHVEGGGQLEGYRGPWYLGIGLSGSGLILSIFYAAMTQHSIQNRLRQNNQQEKTESSDV